MKRQGRICAILILLVVAGCEQSYTPGSVRVSFSPKGGCTEMVVQELDAARAKIRVQAYSFTSAPIAKALLEAHKRGVDVAVLLDRSNEKDKYSSADFLHNVGIPMRIDAQHAIAHNKIIIIDDKTVLTGSFNFTKQAEESNAENLLVLQDPALAQRYTENWELHAAHCEDYVSKREAGEGSSRGRSSGRTANSSGETLSGHRR
jgi:phosphatidylserine/phosphatidylglycerophosphate/cardiolipin synthase-like enzyme